MKPFMFGKKPKDGRHVMAVKTDEEEGSRDIVSRANVAS